METEDDRFHLIEEGSTADLEDLDSFSDMLKSARKRFAEKSMTERENRRSSSPRR